MNLRFDNKMFLNVLLYALKKTFEGQWPECNWSKYSGAMERPIKVNRHKGGGVDIYFWREAWVQILSEPEFFSVFFSAVGKIAAHLRGSCLFFWFYIGSSKEINFFTNTQFKLSQRREPLFWHYAVYKWFECNKQNISVWPKHVFSKWEGWGGNVYFGHSLYEKKSELIIFS